MNVFVLDRDPVQAAEMLCDQHVVKMTLETAQLLCSAHATAPYRRTHHNHPCAVWARSSLANYLWLCSYGEAVAREYTYRFDKTHASEAIVSWAREHVAGLPLPDGGLTPFAQAMPERYRGECPVEAYRRYYVGEKLELRGGSTWRRRGVPTFVGQPRYSSPIAR